MPRRLTALLLVLAFLRAARAGDPSPLPPFKLPKQAREAVQRLDALARRRERELDEMEGNLEDFKDWGRLPRAADADAAMKARTRLAERFDALTTEGWQASRRETMYIDAVNLAAAAHALARTADKLGFAAAAARAADYQVQHVARDQRLVELGREYMADLNERNPVLSETRAAQARARRLRRGAPWVLGGFLLAALALLAWRGRPRRPAAPVPAPPPAPESAPFVVGGRFEAGRLLGRGGVGDIYAAVDRISQREASVHRARAELVAEPGARERFLARTRAVAALKHPNLPRILAVESEGAEVYVVYEPVEGTTLEAALATRGRLEWPAARRVLTGAGFALEAAHAAGIAHGCVEPSSIMLTPAGEARLMDFGVPPAPLRPSDWKTRPRSWAASAYTAPEQENGVASPAVDVFALGVCAYQMVTGTVPFKGPDALDQKFRMDWTPPSRAAAGAPARLDAVVQRALRPAPEERYASMGELVRAFMDV